MQISDIELAEILQKVHSQKHNGDFGLQEAHTKCGVKNIIRNMPLLWLVCVMIEFSYGG